MNEEPHEPHGDPTGHCSAHDGSTAAVAATSEHAGRENGDRYVRPRQPEQLERQLRKLEWASISATCPVVRGTIERRRLVE
jgi:hypothetical protein